MLFPVAFIFLFISFFSLNIHAKDFKEEAKARQSEKFALIDSYREEMLNKRNEASPIIEAAIEAEYEKSLKESDEFQGQGCSVKQSCLNKRGEELNSHNFLGSQTAGDQIVMFISFSMPDASLKSIFKQLAFHQNVRIVIRGLIENSMTKTGQKIKELNGLVDVDPQAFEKCKVERVPAFVLYKNNEPKAKVIGNVTIDFAKDLFKKKGLLS